MEPTITTTAGKETASQTVARVKAQMAAGGGSPSSPGTTTSSSSSVLDALVSRLTQQGQGISTSASTNLQASINEAIAGTQEAGNLKTAALQSEQAREIGFARDRAGATYTEALEGRRGYATQVAGLRELTETTEKSIRDLDSRYQEAILSNDSATAQRIADLQVKKLEFQQEQEQNFYQNMFAIANLQESAIERQQQNEQFWVETQQKNDQFASEMAQSKYQFEQNYGISLQELSLKEKQLDIERARFNLSAQEYADRKKELEKDKNNTFLKGVIANELKAELAAGGGKLQKENLLTSALMMRIREQTGFDGSAEELAGVFDEAYSEMSSDKKFMSQFLSAPSKIPYTSNPVLNARIQMANNIAQSRYSAETGGATIQSPESYFSNIFR